MQQLLARVPKQGCLTPASPFHLTWILVLYRLLFKHQNQVRTLGLFWNRIHQFSVFLKISKFNFDNFRRLSFGVPTTFWQRSRKSGSSSSTTSFRRFCVAQCCMRSTTLKSSKTQDPKIVESVTVWSSSSHVSLQSRIRRIAQSFGVRSWNPFLRYLGVQSLSSTSLGLYTCPPFLRLDVDWTRTLFKASRTLWRFTWSAKSRWYAVLPSLFCLKPFWTGKHIVLFGSSQARM